MPKETTAIRTRRARSRKTDGNPRRALLFISHDSQDHALAEAFENLVRDASGGVLQTFRSSDKKGYSGIAFGAEWYATVMERLAAATDVVALITSNSLDRPWILYEVGVARGRADVPAFGVAFGISLDEIDGPFSQFQNSPDDEDSLVKLVLQLMRRIPDASPREEAVRLHVAAFRTQVPALLRIEDDEELPQDSQTVLFEEVKAMFRVVSDQVAELSRRWPLERRDEEDDKAVPAWAEEAEELLDQLAEAESGKQRTTLWRKLSTLVAARCAARPQGLSTIHDALRAADENALRTGVAELNHYLHSEGITVARDEDDLLAYGLLGRLSTTAAGWAGIRPPKLAP